MLKRFHRTLVSCGIDGRKILSSLTGLAHYLGDGYRYWRLSADTPFPISWKNLYPVLADRHAAAGSASGHYFHMDLWVARKVYQARPSLHVDIGSRIDGFVSHLLTFMPVAVVDIRPLESQTMGLQFMQDDATHLNAFSRGSIPSLSCLHAAEHFGLGRYGDPIDPIACFTLMKNLQRILEPGGMLYFAVPVGQERVEFNAHRVFAPKTILKAFHDLQLVEFAWVDDRGNFYEGDVPTAANDCNYGCGIFLFTKVA